MAAPRVVQRVIAAHPAPVGEGLVVLRALPDAGRRSVGPFVFLDHFGPVEVRPGSHGVPPHPHAGIEVMTVLFDGWQAHRDSAGNAGLVGAGGAQFMTAGRGLVHAEQPAVPAGAASMTLHGLQLWTSLPPAQKLVAPRYRAIDAGEVPSLEHEGARLRLYVGEAAGLIGPARLAQPALLAHLDLAPGAALSLDTPEAFELALYGVEGELSAGGAPVGRGALALLGEGTRLHVANPGSAPAQAMLLGGVPAEGPLLFHGPFVMDTVARLRAAERDWREGRMGRLD